MTLSPGQVVKNRYRVARILGQGGMGTVYRAWDLNLNIPVALKELVPEPGIDPATLAQLRAQFRREAQVLASLAHPNLPRVTDYFEWNGNAYLVMDFVEGESLDALITRQGPLPEAWVVNWAGQLLDALATCHAQRIIHRDIKPQNIIIRPDGQAVLVDFGLVKLWDPRHPQTQRIVRGMGTREYASPEHFYLKGRHTEPRSDLYSLGATLYHALTGQEPPSAIDRWTKTASLIPPRALGVDVRPQVEAVILRAMALEPDHRFQHAREMASALGMQRGVGMEAIGAPVQVGVHPGRRSSTPIALPRDTRWPLEMGTAMVMAVAGTLVAEAILFAPLITPGRYLIRSVMALLVGAIGWFVGDLILQSLVQSKTVGAVPSAGRPTQRLVAFTQRLTRQLSTAQQAALLTVLLVGAAVSAWLLGPLIFSIPVLWDSLPSYAVAGPLAYAATGRRRWRALIAHTLVLSIGGAALRMRMGFGSGVGVLLLAAIVGGLLMEAIAFLSERSLLRQ